MTAGKKGSQLQLQAEINTDEEWVKLVEKEGLIVVDIYSEWCGPCTGMVGNLKKLKVEVGGDNLHLAIAKSDGIDCLKRFRKKSEPTWMFIAGGCIVNLMFGADAPRLTRLIVQELENEAQAQRSERERTQIPFEELTPAEQARKAIEDKREEEIAVIERKAAKIAQGERRRKRSEVMTPFITELDVLIFWPHAFDGHKMIYESWDPLGISVADKETPQLTEEQFEEIFCNTPDILQNDVAKSILLEKPCQTVLLKLPAEKGSDILDKVKSVIYEQTTKSEKTQTGDDNDENETEKTVAEKLTTTNEEGACIPGVYTPVDAISKAAAINALFPKTVAQFIEPEPPPLPPYLAVAFDAFKRKEVLEMCALHESEVLKLGFYTSSDPAATTNIGITPDEYENKHAQKEYGEKLIIMLSKVNREVVLAFDDLGPTHMSTNAVEGAKECAVFFPPGYGEKPKEVVATVKKRRGKVKRILSFYMYIYNRKLLAVCITSNITQ
ncbi:thioredoxin domain-containing protein 3 homolog [Arctopsyche grandis]|uniref:thioredoxin domain-containing protein 3 homolog n=1 Tax=Arctopsyche grandis TaxID=121162 RepID=UPI00406D68A0